MPKAAIYKYRHMFTSESKIASSRRSLVSSLTVMRLEFVLSSGLRGAVEPLCLLLQDEALSS
jgi:hypothetical protein